MMERIERGLKDRSIINAEAFAPNTPGSPGVIHFEKEGGRHFIVISAQEAEWIELQDGMLLRWILGRAAMGATRYTLTAD